MLWKKSLPPSSPCCLCSCMINGGGGKAAQEKKEFFSQINFDPVCITRGKVRDRNKLGSCHWEVICQTITLIVVVKGDSILNCASLKCKCYCKMSCVVFSLSLFRVHVWQYFGQELAGVLGVRHDFKPLSPFAPKKKPSGRIVPETSSNPLKEPVLKPVFMVRGGEIGQVFLCLQSLKLDVARQNAYHQQS